MIEGIIQKPSSINYRKNKTKCFLRMFSDKLMIYMSGNSIMWLSIWFNEFKLYSLNKGILLHRKKKWGKAKKTSNTVLRIDFFYYYYFFFFYELTFQEHNSLLDVLRVFTPDQTPRIFKLCFLGHGSLHQLIVVFLFKFLSKQKQNPSFTKRPRNQPVAIFN